MPEGPHLYPDDDLTDLPDRLLAAEIVREQIFLQTHEEVPYGTTVETENWQDRNDGSVRIEATVYVARPGHKAILIGEGGKRIKTIGARAREELARLLERKVHLFLNVKHRAGWDEEAARLRAIGLHDGVAASMRGAQRRAIRSRDALLFLNVKHRAGWDEEAARLRAIGLRDPGSMRFVHRSRLRACRCRSPFMPDTLEPASGGRYPADMESRVTALEHIARTTAATWSGWSGDSRRSSLRCVRPALRGDRPAHRRADIRTSVGFPLAPGHHVGRLHAMLVASPPCWA